MFADDGDQYSLRSPGSSFSSNDAYQTPSTSPEPSPLKRFYKPYLEDLVDIAPFQLDGGHEDSNASTEQADGGREDFNASAEQADRRHEDFNASTLQIEDKVNKDAVQCSVLATPKRAGVVARTRNPALLLQSATRSSSIRRRKYGINHSDRFIPGRNETPTKQRLQIIKPLTDMSTIFPGSTPPTQDPFSPPRRRDLRSDQQFSVTRNPVSFARSYGTAGSRVQRPAQHNLDTIWTVGGLTVTEGIASTSDGRGGRVTSGTNAPLYNASVIVSMQMLDEDLIHARRLAVAMDIEHTGKMLMQAENKPMSGDRKTAWKDGRWVRGGPMTLEKTSKPAKVSIAAFKILDAPELRNDFYCTLLAYSPTLHCIAVGLAKHVYIWYDKKTFRHSNIQPSMLFPDDHGHVTSLCFSSKIGGRSILAIGFADGRLVLWDPRECAPRLKCNAAEPISHVSFRPFTSKRTSVKDDRFEIDAEELLVGTESGRVLLYTIEWPSSEQSDLFGWASCVTLRTVISCNQQQICGIAWSARGDTFACGGNDNQLFVFEWNKIGKDQPITRARSGHESTEQDCPLITPGLEKQLFALNAAVKAIAFAPWQRTLLAARGGSNDRCIHFLHTHSGATLATINCHAQVTSLVWNKNRKEIAATLGFAQPDHPYRVVVFAWPSCEQLLSIPWLGEERALYGISYPGGRDDDCIVVATSDHSIKFHEVWSRGKGVMHRASHAKSQILNDICSEALESEMQIR